MLTISARANKTCANVHVNELGNVALNQGTNQNAHAQLSLCEFCDHEMKAKTKQDLSGRWCHCRKCILVRVRRNAFEPFHGNGRDIQTTR